MMNGASLEPIAQIICRERRLVFGGRLGEGIYKETFLVRRPNGNPAAMKIFKPGMRPDRIHREIAAMHRCNHPNVARLLKIDSFTYEGAELLYFTEPYLGGGTLAQRLAGGRTLALAQVRELAYRLSAALTYLAFVQLVHRDIKPENIMFRDSGEWPILVDFGLARDLKPQSFTLTMTRAARGPGTPLYAAPEQLNNLRKEIDWRTDQFALGAVLSKAAFGFHPYEEEGDPPDVVAERVARYGMPSKRFRAAVAAAGLPVLIRMTAAVSDQRVATPDELQAAWSA